MKAVKMVSVTLTIIVILALSRCQGFLLQLNPEFIDTQITEKVTLTCLPGGRTSIDEAIISMRILKEGDTDHWKVIAEMENNKTDITVYEKNLFPSGHIGNLNDSYLTITWKFVTVSILGTYRCDVQGFKTDGDLILEISQEIISEHNATIQNVLFLIKEEKENKEDALKAISKRIENINQLLQNTSYHMYTHFNVYEEKIRKLEKSMRNVTLFMEDSSMRDDTMEEKMTNLHNFMKENLTQISQKCDLTEAVTKNLTKTLVQMSAVVDSLVTKMQAANQTETQKLWPQGYYGLMATSEGCPGYDSNIWVSGYYKHHTESTDANHDQISPNNHFLKPVRETNNNQNFIYQHFCIKINSSSNYYWPEGSYCINKYTSECPHSFNSGYIQWDNEDTNPYSSTNGSVPQSGNSTHGNIFYYCCRSDGSASAPVYLPKDKPFYLYRYKGQCQQVYEMSVSEEFILFDTENNNNLDRYESDVHPDGQAKNDVRLELCYYSPI